jgi:2-octaprenyl-6-methoxyphenol hydroxylase
MSSSDQPFDIVIAGGSLTGLSLVLAIRSALPSEFRMALVERRPAGISELVDLRASALSLASRRFLAVVDVWPSIEPEAEPVTEIDITDASPETAIRPVLLHYDNVAGGEAAAYILPNETLKQALISAAAQFDDVSRFDGGGIEAIEPDQGAAALRLANGNILRARLVIAADGRSSAVRALAGIKTTGWRYDQHGIVTTVGHELPHGGRAIQHFLPAGPFAILPLKGGYRSSLVWTEAAKSAEALVALDDVAFLDELRHRFSGRLGELTLEGPRQHFPLEMHLARHFYASRVALAGDSARGVHPLAGQGFNIALRDVAALAEIVAETARLGLDIGSAEPLERYQRWRRFDSVASALGMDGLNRLFSNDNTGLRALRDLGLGLVDRAPHLKRFLVAEAAGMTGKVPRLLKGQAI